MSDSNFSFLANNSSTIEEMLSDLGLKSLNDLFKDVPEHLLLKNIPLDNLPNSHTELETLRKLTILSKKNLDSTTTDMYLGSGIYDHFIPAAVEEIVNRAEFKTAYTPYAPELSQGMLTALYEYQSMICELTGLDIANTSMYDWSTALAEAALMTMRINNKVKDPVFLVSKSIHNERLETLKTYSAPLGLKIVNFSYSIDGKVDIADLRQKLTDNVVGIYIETPNLFGIIETEIEKISEFIAKHKALFVLGIDPISLGILEAPGNLGIDICVGEAHHLGSAPNFGGPSLGILTSKNTKKNIRNMPGRIIGYTKTKDEKRDAYIMTLQTREQHIRREKATSNICTNESLFSIAAAAYLSLMGPKGLEIVGTNLMGKIAYIVEEIQKSKITVKVHFSGPFFKEVLLFIPKGNYIKLRDYLQTKNILIGANISEINKNFKDSDGFIFSVTEKHTKEQLENFINELINFDKGGN